MGDLIGVFLVIALAIFVTFMAASVVLSRQQAQLGHRAPVPGSSAKEANAQARVSYHIAQQAVLILDHLVNDDMINVVIPEATQQRIRSLSKEFYEL